MSPENPGTITQEQVEKANRRTYNEKDLEKYRRNESIFNRQQEKRLTDILAMLRDETGGHSFLDVGCGTGNLLDLARRIFPFCVGADQAEQMLVKLRLSDLAEEPQDSAEAGAKVNARLFVSASARHLPFADASFDVVGMYALLHHLYDPLPAFAEAFRLLKPGGMLYTDHDPNRYFGRFYHGWYRWRHRGRVKIGSADEDLAEYHNVYTDGLDPEKLAEGLRQLGFQSVTVRYRHSTSTDMSGFNRFIRLLLKGASRIAPLRSFYSHFMLFARR